MSQGKSLCKKLDRSVQPVRYTKGMWCDRHEERQTHTYRHKNTANYAC